jgi:hypothetical protein
VKKTVSLTGMIDYSLPADRKLRCRTTLAGPSTKRPHDAVFSPLWQLTMKDRIRILNKWMARVLDLDANQDLLAIATTVIRNPSIIALLKEWRKYRNKN